MKLSNRETKLIYLLIIVVIVAILYFGINYIYDRTNALNEEYNNVKSQSDYTRMTIQNDVKVKETLSELRNKASELSGELLPMMTTEEVDRYVTSRALNNSSTPLTLSSSVIENATPAPYVPLSDHSESYYAAAGSIWLYTVDFTFSSSSSDNLKAIVDAFNSDNSIRIESFSITEGANEATLSGKLSVYMFEALEGLY